MFWLPLGILHRMIFWELVRVFLLSLTGLTGLVLIAGLIQQASQLGLSPSQVLSVIPLLIPSTLPYTIPATTLFASCVVYGRLSNDNEAVAIKAAGIDLFTILRPAIALGLLTTLVTGALYYSLIPRTQQMLQEQVLQDPEEVLYNWLRRERRFVLSNFPYVIYVRDVQGRRLIDVVVKQRDKIRTGNGTEVWFGYDFVARAAEARLIVDRERNTLKIDSDKWVMVGKTTALESNGSAPPEVALPEMFSGKTIKARPMALEWDELPERIHELEEHKRGLIVKRDENRRVIEETQNPFLRQTAIAQEPHYKAQIEDTDRQIRTVMFEQNMRPALAVGCLCFALIGCPVGIWANRADYLSTFVISFLPTVLAYYPLLLAGGGLAREGRLPMSVGVWAADGIAGLAALFLTYVLIRR